MKHYFTSIFKHHKRLIILYFYSDLLVFSIMLGSYISMEEVWYYNKFSSSYCLKLLLVSMLVSIPLSVIFKKCIDFCVGKYPEYDNNRTRGGVWTCFKYLYWIHNFCIASFFSLLSCNFFL